MQLLGTSPMGKFPGKLENDQDIEPIRCMWPREDKKFLFLF